MMGHGCFRCDANAILQVHENLVRRADTVDVFYYCKCRVDLNKPIVIVHKKKRKDRCSKAFPNASEEVVLAPSAADEVVKAPNAGDKAGHKSKTDGRKFNSVARSDPPCSKTIRLDDYLDDFLKGQNPSRCFY
ncbi:hypothetical protein C5167_016606 [Papaver somniferum]|nr:hypothetical protein C5167_016606 [Papaver somniferum]